VEHSDERSGTREATQTGKIERGVYRSNKKTYIDTNEIIPIKNIGTNILPAALLIDVRLITSIMQMTINNSRQNMSAPKYKKEI